MENLRIKGLNGSFTTNVVDDKEYPAITVEFVSDQDEGQTNSRPTVRLEFDAHSKTLRALIWNDVNSDDYTDEIVLDKNYINNFKNN